jgi:hypothetical protein
MKRHLRILLAAALIGVFTNPALATNPTKELPQKLPSKLSLKAERSQTKVERSEIKRSRIDFTNADSAKDDAVIEAVPTVVKSRKVVAAPPGDLAEPLSSFDKPAGADKTIVSSVKEIEVSSAIVLEMPKSDLREVEFVGPKPATPAVVFPVASIVPVEEYHQTLKTAAPAATSEAIAIVPKTISFLRAGYLNANYKKFDDRVHNSATSIGLGLARGFSTAWGAFEARASLDAYHAMDQSVTIDNIRMLSVRTEAAYWLSHSRVKPGISLGLGWADYSIRSYRSVSSADEKTVTLRTHAKSRAFSVIPATSLRVELGDGLMIDTQTEFLALLGGDNADAAQGFGVTVSLGWIF